MNANEELAVLTAMQKVIKNRLDDLKADAKDNLIRLEEETGADRIALKIGGSKVGEVSIMRAHPSIEINAGAYDEALDFLGPIGLLETAPAKSWRDAFDIVAGPDGPEVCYRDTGEVVTWAYVQPGYVKGTTVRVKDAEVKKALPLLGRPDMLAGLIGGGQ